jgi:hypothetical protein
MRSSTALILPDELPATRLCTSEDAQSGFECEHSSLHNFFRDFAVRHQRQDISRTWVLPRPEGLPHLPPVLGFYTLTLAEVATPDYASAVGTPQKKTPRFATLPVVLLGRLARHLRLRGATSGGVTVGAILLDDAQLRALSICELAGGVAVIVDAKDAHAADFYGKHGYRPLIPSEQSWPRRMFYPMETIRSAEASIR